MCHQQQICHLFSEEGNFSSRESNAIAYKNICEKLDLQYIKKEH